MAEKSNPRYNGSDLEDYDFGLNSEWQNRLMDERSKHNPVSSIMDAQGLPEEQFLNAWGDDLVLDQDHGVGFSTEWWERLLDSNEHNSKPVSPTLGGEVEPEGRRQLDHSPSGLSVVRYLGEAAVKRENTAVSRKRSRDDQTKKTQVAQQDYYNQPTINSKNAAISNQDLLRAEKDEIISAFVFHTGDFLTVRLDKEWQPLLDWAKACSGITDESDTMKDFVERFNAKELEVNSKIVRRPDFNEPTVNFKNTSMELFRVGKKSPGRLLIQPEGLRGREHPHGRLVKPIKRRICKLLEFLGIFHGLAVSHGVNKILGARGNLQELVGWVLDIFFAETRDGLPLFGWFEGTPEVPYPAESEFGNLKRAMSGLLAEKKIALAQRKTAAGCDVVDVALSLLGYWYQETALKFDGWEPKFHHMIYWSKMAELNTRKRLFPTLGKPFLQQFHEYYFDFDE
ncbi:hypothetical protein PCANC_25021 [Puccinia coronata f. sp. avenae]|uniref:Uncharacterized protein n=1 Tax=Puccinia coronata f. sp. avenae TaxID=200324 RepID=A0A2N5TME2_9BASI|nr:hypothetical protein PCANC_25021 [Puccinia coronata f. sp. avenae]